MQGNAGNDSLLGEAGNDTLSGDAGDDAINGGDGNDVINGGPGKDDMQGGAGNDRIYARDGEVDHIGCSTGRDRVRADRIDIVSLDCERVSRR
jgi:Ca2+-binding RTX toxin-like protein